MGLLLNIDVPDLEAAERFYVATFDLKVFRKWTADVIEMKGWPVRLFLLRKDEGSIGAPGNARSYTRHWTPIHFDVVVPDVAAGCARALTVGGIVEQAPTRTAFGTMAVLADPFGNGFCLLQFNEHGYEALTCV